MLRTTAGPVDNPAWRWTVDGVSPEAQAAARRAAERDGLPLGAWMEAAIMDAVERSREMAEDDAPVPEDPRPTRRYF
jgi:hypothetical protein